jgi:hypothetical protein
MMLFIEVIENYIRRFEDDAIMGAGRRGVKRGLAWL